MSVSCDVFLRHRTRVFRGVPDRNGGERHAVSLRLLADDGDRSLREVALERGLDRRRSCRARLGLVDLRGDSRERALEVPEGVGAHALYLRLFLEDAGERIAERPRAGHLHVSVAVFFPGAELRAHGNAVPAADALGNGADAAAELPERGFHVLYELRLGERNLGKVDEVRAVVWPHSGERRRGGEKARVAAHDYVDLHAAKRPVVQVVAADRARDEPCRRPEAGRVVAGAQIVVDRLRDVVDDERISLFLGLFRDDARGVRGVVAADVEEVADVQLPERLEDGAAVRGVRLPAAAAERGRRGFGDGLELFRGRFPEVDVVVSEDPEYAVARAEYSADLRRLAGLEHCADERLVDYH